MNTNLEDLDDAQMQIKAENNYVKITFSAAVSWVGIQPQKARQIASAIIAAADKVERSTCPWNRGPQT